uniref:Chitinase n=1 Tax=Todarodes pacificus TaxID=6637 RepID=A0A193PD55_TODPA|nr:chitinase [Todarodes pacificus]
MLAVSLLFLLAIGGVSSAGHRRVCYHSNWSQYRPAPGKYLPESIDPFLCTHICYAFAKLNGNHLTAFEWNDESEPWMKGMFERTIALKKKNPALKILISLGGWNMGSPPFTAMVANAGNRKAFIDHGIKWMRRLGFDGLDVDWEYPANRGSPPGDKDKFTALIRETRLAFDADAKATGKPRLLLASAVSAGKDKIDTAYDIPAISKYFDFITVMTYDLHGAWEKFTGHNSPLYVRSDEQGDQRYLNMKWAMDYWVSKGAPKSILNVGMALYGRGFTLTNKANTKPGASTKGPCHAGRFTREKGFQSYYEICDMIKTGGTVHWIKEQESPYVVKGDQWIGYDNPKSLAIKVNWVKAGGYGGIAVWALPLDDFGGMCGGEKYPLMKTIVRTLGDSVVPSEGPPVITPKPPTLAPNKDNALCAGKPDGTYAHPTSCTDYVLCEGGITYKDHCLSGMWNDMIKACDPTPGFECRRGNKVVTNPPEVTRKPVTRPLGKKNEGFCSGKADGLYPDPASCENYFSCASGLTFPSKCAANTGFDPKILGCNYKNAIPGCF